MSTAIICILMVKVFERHGVSGSNDLHTLRPIGGRNYFRDGVSNHDHFSMLWYEQDLGNGQYTSRAVRVDKEKSHV